MSTLHEESAAGVLGVAGQRSSDAPAGVECASLGALVQVSVQVSVVLAAFGSVAFSVFEFTGPLGARPLRAGVSLLLSALGMGAFVVAHGGAAPGFARRLARGTATLLPTLSVVAALPFVLLLTSEERGLGAAAVALAAAVVHAWTTPSDGRLTGNREWPFVTLSVALFVTAIYLAVGLEVSGNTDNDSAYYFGVARHLVRTHRYEEPVVWHFLVQHPSAVHAPFDYWHGLTSVCLAPAFAAFGATFRVLGTTMALVSAGSVLLFWYLISVAARFESAWVQVTSLLAFGFAPAFLAQRFDAETVPFTHLWMLSACVAFARGRVPLGIAFGFMMFYTRADTVSVLAILCAFGLYQELRTGTGPAWRVLATALALSGAYFAYHYALFGSPIPPAARLVPFLTDGGDLYRFREAPLAHLPIPVTLTPDFIDGRLAVALETYARNGFFPHGLVWLALGAGASLPRRPVAARMDLLAVAILLGGTFVVTWTTTPVFSQWRTLHPLLPAFVLAGGYGADAWLRRLTVGLGGFRRALSSAFAAGLAAFMLFPLRPYREPHPRSAIIEPVRQASQYFGEGPVMSSTPWFVLALTDRPSVLTPHNGEAAMSAVITHYDVRTLLLLDASPCPEASARTCAELLAGKRSSIGTHRLERVAERDGWHVFRVVRP